MIEDLCRPQAYPPPTPSRITRRETHASWVFLADDEVWKIKRPVNFGFLDYSDRDKRRRCCQEEVRLGRRLAPSIYRGVAPVYQGDAGFSFVGPGIVVDHVVRMSRLPDEQSARALLAAGQLHPPMLRHLAEHLAAFYAAAPATPGFGCAARLKTLVDDNHQQSVAWAPRFVSRATLEGLLAWSHATLQRQEGRITLRTTEGRVREGHGDLRLEHVYFSPASDQAPLIIDPIEFNETFRCLDVALDVAFFAMELESFGRRDLGEYFLSCFARATNDFGFYPILDLYLCYRAWVRAKVACIVAGDASTPGGKGVRKGSEAVALFELAQRYTSSGSRTRSVVAVGGMIGAGKSTIADALALALPAAVIASDATRKHLGGVPETTRGEPALYSDELTRRTYQEMSRRAQLVLDGGRAVVVDATFRDAAVRAAIREQARRAGCPFLFVEVTCDEATVRTRLRARGTAVSVSDAREDLLPWMKDQYRSPEELPCHERITVDGSLPIANSVGAILNRLRPRR